MTRPDLLTALTAPRAIAVIGASADPDKLSGRPVAGLLEAGYEGRIVCVNPARDEVQGLPCHPTLAAAGGPIDLAVLTVPASRVMAALHECAEAGVALAVVFASGFAEAGEADLQDELARLAESSGMRILGPNCIGAMALKNGVVASFSRALHGLEPVIGPVALVSQSGAFGACVLSAAQQAGIGVHSFVNTGNEADLTVAEAMTALAEDPEVGALLVYTEGVSDGPELLRAARRARELDKPVVAIKVGRTAEGALAVASHTGALTGSDAVYDAAFEAAGVVRVDGMADLVDAARILTVGKRAAGDRLTVLSMSGGVGILMTDLAGELGLRQAEWDAEWQRRMAAVIPSYGSAANPVDMTAQLNTEPEILACALDIACAHPGTDVIAVFIGVLAGDATELVDALARVETDKPIVVAWTGGDGTPLRRLTERGVPAYDDANRALRALGMLVRHAGGSATPAPTEPDPARTAAAMKVITRARDAGHKQLDEAQSKELLRAYGIPCTPERPATTPGDAVTAAAEIGFPVAVKLLSADVAHKSDLGGVSLGLTGETAVRDAATEIMNLARDAGIGDVRLLVQRMAAPGVELIAGARVDPVFGPVVMTGLGGVFVEVLQDTALTLAPAEPGRVREILRSLRGSALLHGVRGRPAADEEAIVDIVVRLSELAADLAGELAEIDINPIIAGETGALVVDALVVLQ
ncbi:acetate--CoA ligase family protein [Actinomadura barringtoniae]|uniref:Acetate--CoA ligase family protein n=1 Tax=Actinomadura barringtoniae TaxID=1427535 RepID=A0A939T4Q0_9ACTN|nr:acetate--CoA ligase family protein [Actinomadura barringtoniae]MBO2452811.1 acetate--CoA ligase family protein [Actinomadura barringtoniae]